MFFADFHSFHKPHIPEGPVPNWFFPSSFCLWIVAGPVVTVDKTEHVFRSVLSKQLWKSARFSADFHSCGSFHRPAPFRVFLSFWFFFFLCGKNFVPRWPINHDRCSGRCRSRPFCRRFCRHSDSRLRMLTLFERTPKPIGFGTCLEDVRLVSDSIQ